MQDAEQVAQGIAGGTAEGNLKRKTKTQAKVSWNNVAVEDRRAILKVLKQNIEGLAIPRGGRSDGRGSQFRGSYRGLMG